MGLVGRVVVALAASALTWVLLAFAAATSSPRRSRLRRMTGWLPRPDSANLMSYVAALMAVTLAGTIALTG
jgi:hypothetical protein